MRASIAACWSPSPPSSRGRHAAAGSWPRAPGTRCSRN